MLAKNPYEVLEISCSCTNEDIMNAYRRLSLKYNPKRQNPKEYAVNSFYFHQVSEAFVVLIDRKYNLKITVKLLINIFITLTLTYNS